MRMTLRSLSGVTALLSVLFLAGCQGLVSGGTGGGGTPPPPPPPPPQQFQLTVTSSGPGTGTVASSPAGIKCPGTCNATFSSGTQVTLTATPGSTFAFTGWSGACTGTGTCTVKVNAAASVTASFGGTLQSINHIVFMVQENRGFDHRRALLYEQAAVRRAG